MFAVSNPVLVMNITPAKPIATADHLVNPTFSFKNNMLKIVTNIGAANVNEMVEASSRFRKAIKIEAMLAAPKRLLQRWRPMFFVL